MKVRTTILLQENLLRKLKKQAFEENTSVTNIIERLVKEYFDKNVKVDKLLWIKNEIESKTDDELKKIIITPSLETATSITSLTISLYDVKQAMKDKDIQDIKKIVVFISLAFIKKMLALVKQDILYVEEENLNPFSVTVSIKNSFLSDYDKKLITNSILNLSDSFPNISYFEQNDSFKIVIKSI